MKKNKIILAGATVAIAGLALASCKPQTEDNGDDGNYTRDDYNYVAAPEAPTNYSDLSNKEVKVWLNYNGTAGITYRGATAYPNPVDEKTYTTGTLLPTWKRFADVLKLDLKDVANYADKDDKASYKTFAGYGYTQKDGTGVDLYSNSVSNINTMGKDGYAQDLTPFIEQGKMPNFKKYLDENPSIKAQITSNGGIYYTPYFDGYNKFERAFVMDTTMVEKLLDTDDFSGFDTTVSGKGAESAKVVKEASYTPFIDATHNYKDAETKVKVSVKAQAKEITIKQTDNIIVQQNNSLKAGVSGKDLAQQFKNYLKAAFGHEVGSGKTYSKYSQIFVGEQAAYNCDELVALMRVVRANPSYLTGGDAETIETFIPRGEAKNRVANILDLAQIWGVQGLDSEANNFYFDANGKMHSLATTPSSYEALGLLNSLYKEGLIVNDFYRVPATGAQGTRNIARYLSKTANDYGYAFLMYDYTAATGAANDMADGVGTNPEGRKCANKTVQGIRAIVSPLTMWGNLTNWDHDQALTNMTGKTLMRYTESNRSLKSGSWCIPKSATNVDGALRLMDVTFSEWGALVNTFGPEEYWYVPKAKQAEGGHWIATDISGDEKAPVFSAGLVSAWQGVTTKPDFWSFMREYIGATHGIGGVRNNQCDFQATNAYAQVGVRNLANAIASGAVLLAQVKSTNGFGTSVPTNYSQSVAKTIAAQYEPLTDFWTDPGKESPDAWVTIVVNGLGYTGTVCTDDAGAAHTLAEVRACEAKYNELYLYTLANSVDPNAVPSYANPKKA